ncbi:ATP-dependent Zn protease [Pseudorhizobium flavum]|uniref:ATP-dependent Zn protease n=1 Tax=Pseudorhizobium flavum TaxID=1335061 RepID=UPI0024939114|nr:ATP-dependent Zn protease [Pseudorhizobium flavum]
MDNAQQDISKTAPVVISPSPLRRLALAAQGMTGADIERVVREARQRARRARRPLAYKDIQSAIAGSAERLSPELRWRISLHEAGHALMWSLTEIGTVVSMTTGQTRGGETRVEISTEATQTEAGMMSLIACLLGGRAAELTVLGETMIGGGGSERSDLALATAHATHLETMLGCSSSKPLLYMPPERISHDLRFDHGLAERVHQRLEAAMGIALDAVREHREVLLILAKALDTATYLDGRFIADILSLTKP